MLVRIPAIISIAALLLSAESVVGADRTDDLLRTGHGAPGMGPGAGGHAYQSQVPGPGAGRPGYRGGSFDMAPNGLPRVEGLGVPDFRVPGSDARALGRPGYGPDRNRRNSGFGAPGYGPAVRGAGRGHSFRPPIPYDPWPYYRRFVPATK